MPSKIPKLPNTVEILSESNHVDSLWDHPDEPLKSMIYFGDYPTKFRMMGPFVKAQRCYFPDSLRQFLSHNEIRGVLNQESDAYNHAVEEIDRGLQTMEIVESKHVVNDLTRGGGRRYDPSGNQNVFEELDALYNNPRWQRCIISNAYNYNTMLVGLVVLTGMPIRNIADTYERGAGKRDNERGPISGIRAHDITITRAGKGLKTKYRVTISKKPQMLSTKIIQSVYRQGLIDAIRVIKAGMTRAYVYNHISDYRLPTTFLDDLLASERITEEDMHLEAIESEIHELPREAFENNNVENNPIGQLDF